MTCLTFVLKTRNSRLPLYSVRVSGLIVFMNPLGTVIQRCAAEENRTELRRQHLAAGQFGKANGGGSQTRVALARADIGTKSGYMKIHIAEYWFRHVSCGTMNTGNQASTSGMTL